ncbi:MAG TPA: hypothetical protein EYQ44_05950 [Porticoccaceae bacterium]|nr:hypothetical protein [Porticoccaceae bacterium]HIL76835.1 hypothetical protein [Rhodospirillales bacterium]
MPDWPSDPYNHNYWLVADSDDHIEIKGRNSKLNTWLYALNKYDTVFFQYTDECKLCYQQNLDAVDGTDF